MSRGSTGVASIDERIQTLRGVPVLLDSDLATLYGVTTGALLQAMKRNRGRFPADCSFQLTNQEVRILRSQPVISSSGSTHGGRRYQVYAFTEQGVAMLSSVLRSTAAIAVNIEIVRAFVRLRRASVVSERLIAVVAELAKRVDTHDAAIRSLIQTIRRLVQPSATSTKRPIGFVPIR